MYKYFTKDELKCQHCGEEGMDVGFMLKIEILREALGFSFPVTSGYRCPQHPIEARKSSPGAHSTGHAVDIRVRGKSAYRLLQGALSGGFTGIGVSQKGLSRFIHLDDIEDSEGRPRPTVWSY